MTDQQAQREVPATAGAEHRHRTGPQRSQQPGRVVGLLLRRCGLPAGRGRAAPVAAPVIADDHELISQQVSERVEMAAIARRPHDQQDGRPGAPDLVIEFGPVDNHARHLHTPRRLPAIFVPISALAQLSGPPRRTIRSGAGAPAPRPGAGTARRPGPRARGAGRRPGDMRIPQRTARSGSRGAVPAVTDLALGLALQWP
jgi:hypothetical protein